MFFSVVPFNTVYLFFSEGTNIFLRGGGSTATTIANWASLGLIEGEWYNLVATISGTVGKIYVDGKLVSTGTVDPIGTPTGTDKFYIGYGATYEFKGQMGRKRIINGALSPEEISQIYTSQKYYYGK